MPELQDESELAGNGAGRVSEQQQQQHDAHSSAEDTPHKSSETDPPKKKRKVNHGTNEYPSWPPLPSSSVSVPD
jgi:hypothetical protein